MLVGSLQLPRPLLFPFIYPPNLCMLMFAAQRFVSGIVSPTRPILYGVRYCPPRHPSPTPPRRHRSAGVSEIWRVGSYGPMEVVHRVRGPQVSPVAVGRRSSEGGGGGQVGGTTLSANLATAYLDGDDYIDRTESAGSIGTPYCLPWAIGI